MAFLHRRRLPHATSLLLEPLEDRCTPAVVVGAVVNGTLTITLDNTTGNNVLIINEVSNPGGGAVSINGGATITGVVNILVNSVNDVGASDQIVYFGDGTLSGNSFIAGMLTVNSNGNAVLLVGVGTATALRDANILGGVVINNPNIAAMHLRIGDSTLPGGVQTQIGSLVVNTNAALVPFGVPSGIYNTSVTNQVSIAAFDLGNTGSTFAFEGSAVGTFFSLQTGNGTDTLFFGTAGTVTVGQNLGIDFRAAPGGAQDTAFIGNAVVNGSAVLIGGAGSQNFVLGGGIPNTILGNLTVNMGGGGTALLPDTFTFDGFLGGNLNHQGSGIESFNLSAAANTVIGGYVSYNNNNLDGIGSFISLGANAAGAPIGAGAPFTTIGSFLSILTGNGADLIAVANTRVGQNFAVNTGAGVDIIALNSIAVIGLMFGDTGAGADILSFDGRDFNTAPVTDGVATQIFGPVNLTLGSEVDTVFFGDGLANSDVTIWFSPFGTINGQAPVGGNAFVNISELNASNPVLIF